MIVESALIDAYNLYLMKLYDKSLEAETIPNLIQKCKKNKELFCNPKEVLEKLEEFEQEMKSDEWISNAINVLRLRRDKYHTHNDKKYFGKKITKDHSYLPKYHIWRLRDFSEDVLSFLWEQLTDKECQKTKYNNDLDNLQKQNK